MRVRKLEYYIKCFCLMNTNLEDARTYAQSCSDDLPCISVTDISKTIKVSFFSSVEKRPDRDELHNELSRRLTGKPISKPKPQNVLLSTRSTPSEVVDWLHSKSFSQRYI